MHMALILHTWYPAMRKSLMHYFHNLHPLLRHTFASLNSKRLSNLYWGLAAANSSPLLRIHPLQFGSLSQNQYLVRSICRSLIRILAAKGCCFCIILSFLLFQLRLNLTLIGPQLTLVWVIRTRPCRLILINQLGGTCLTQIDSRHFHFVCLTRTCSRSFHFAPSEEALIYDLREIFIFIYFLLLNLTFS